VIEDRRLRRVLARAALKSAERELAIARAQLVTGDMEAKERVAAAQEALAAVRKDLARIEAGA